MYEKEPKEPIFWSGQLEPTWRLVGGGSGRGANIYVHWRLRVRTPPCPGGLGYNNCVWCGLCVVVVGGVAACGGAVGGRVWARERDRATRAAFVSSAKPRGARAQREGKGGQLRVWRGDGEEMARENGVQRPRRAVSIPRPPES